MLLRTYLLNLGSNCRSGLAGMDEPDEAETPPLCVNAPARFMCTLVDRYIHLPCPNGMSHVVVSQSSSIGGCLDNGTQ